MATLCAALVAAANADVTFETMALKGQQAPGTDAGVAFALFGRTIPPTINDTGQVAFDAFVTGSGVKADNDSGVWTGSSNALHLAVREGDPAPDTPPGVTFTNFATNGTRPVLGDGERVVVGGSLNGTGMSTTNGIWTGLPGDIRLLARSGDPAPDLSAGVNFFGVNNFMVMNRAGQVAFFAGLSGTGISPSNNSAIWTGAPGAVHLVAREGDHAPGTPSDTLFDSFSAVFPVISGNGQIAFKSALVGASTDSTNNSGVWVGTVGAVQMIARAGDPAPGTSPGVNFAKFNQFQPATINNSGQVGFCATLSGTGVVAGSNDTALFEGASSGMQLIARQGDSAPGLPGGVFYGAFSTGISPLVNHSGKVGFEGTLTGSGIDSTNDRAIWSGGVGDLHLIAREGDRAPGTADGVALSSISGPPVMNAQGDVLWAGILAGPGIDSTNNSAVWLSDATGLATLLVRTGQAIDVDDGPGVDLRTISIIGIGGSSGGEDGEPMSLNDARQVSLQLQFTDGSEGVFVASVPEPVALLVFLAAAVFRRSRRLFMAICAVRIPRDANHPGQPRTGAELSPED